MMKAAGSLYPGGRRVPVGHALEAARRRQFENLSRAATVQGSIRSLTRGTINNMLPVCLDSGNSPPAIATDFIRAGRLAGLNIANEHLLIDVLAVPHQPPARMPAGHMAVYVFMYGDRCLKVGKAGPRTQARYCTHHYGQHAPSTLAKSLVNRQGQIGLDGIDFDTVRRWLCENTSRVNFLLPASYGAFTLSLLEAFVQCRLQPIYEGANRVPAVPE
jgi:hypothetical protein